MKLNLLIDLLICCMLFASLTIGPIQWASAGQNDDPFGLGVPDVPKPVDPKKDEAKKQKPEDEGPVTDTKTIPNTASLVPSNYVRFHMWDGTIVAGEVQVDGISVKTEFGVLVVPIERVRKFFPGLNSIPEMNAKIESLVEGLGDKDFDVREKSHRELASMGMQIRDAIEKFEDGGSAERKKRLAAIKQEINEALDEFDEDDSMADRSMIRGDAVETPEFEIVGKILQESFTIKSKFGQLLVQLSDIRMAERPVDQKKEIVRVVWSGFFGVAYGPFRDGQRPWGNAPTKPEICQDLMIIAKHWKMLRTYGSENFSRQVCEVIQEEKLPLYLMVGAWVATEKDNDQPRRNNQTQVNQAIALANDFPEIVIAISVGNESLFAKSDHKIETDRLIRYIRQVRRETTVPVTVADDFSFWISDASLPVAAELDFLVTHIYAMWHSRQLNDAMTFTKNKLAAVKQRHPEMLIVIGEAGWATSKLDAGRQADLLRGEAGEAQQAQFYRDFKRWVKEEHIPAFYFEAFDENWKGTRDPKDAEKHWGVFKANREPKEAMSSDE